METALLLIAHGSRQAEANEDLLHLAGELRRRGDVRIVEPAYLELAEPTIAEAGRRCVACGAGRVILVPYFLSPGRHATADLEGHRATLGQAHPGVEFMLAAPLGRHALLVDIVTQRVREAVAARPDGAGDAHAGGEVDR